MTATIYSKPCDCMNVSKEKLIGWRREDVFTRIDHPTNIKRARSLGYKAKQGFVLVRTKIRKGGRHKPKPAKGRNPAKMGLNKFTPKQSLQTIVEKRVARKFPNMEILNSYYAGEDGTQTFYEVILVDPSHPVIKSDKNINWICNQRKRVFRGRTSSARKSRDI